MKESTTNPGMKWRLFWFFGWANFLLGVWLCLSYFKEQPPLLFYVSLGLLFAVSLAYVAGCIVSRRWRARGYRFYFGPYLLGAGGWLILYLTAVLMDRILNQ